MGRADPFGVRSHPAPRVPASSPLKSSSCSSWGGTPNGCLPYIPVFPGPKERPLPSSSPLEGTSTRPPQQGGSQAGIGDRRGGAQYQGCGRQRPLGAGDGRAVFRAVALGLWAEKSSSQGQPSTPPGPAVRQQPWGIGLTLTPSAFLLSRLLAAAWTWKRHHECWAWVPSCILVLSPTLGILWVPNPVAFSI